MCFSAFTSFLLLMLCYKHMQICALCSRYSQSTCPVFKEPDDDGGKRLLCEAVCRLG